jgi:hypothetical protein
MRHDQLFLFVDLQQRLTAQPVKQIVGIRRIQQRVRRSLGLLRLIPAKTASRCRS